MATGVGTKLAGGGVWPPKDREGPGKETGSGKLENSDLDESEFCPSGQYGPGKPCHP